ncbi:MAG: helix-turn-helix domain-containing protein [Polyangiaceae bacterium]
MSLREFFALHRAELLRASKSELNGETELEQRARELCALLDAPSALEPPDRGSGRETLFGDDLAIRRARASIEQLARRSRIPVLFLGEVGSGKRRSAWLLHACTYPDGEIFELQNDEQLPLLERKLSALRAPSSALAIGGLSIYVHELGDTSRAVQAALARLLRERGLQCRLMATSQRPLAHACRAGFLRSDLVFDFSATVELPSLRERLADLPQLLEHLASRTGSPLVFSDAALEALMNHTWPGNLIELSRLVERLQRLHGVATIGLEHLTELGQEGSGYMLKLTPNGIDLAELERQLLLQALALTDNNRTRAARLLGLTRDQIRYRLAKIELPLGAAEEGAAE